MDSSKDGDITWEVAVSKGLRARRSVAVGKAGSADLLVAAQGVLAGGYGLLITRTDQTAEALRKRWESEFYDIDKAGRRRRRFRKTSIEREWEKFFADARKDARSNRSNRKQGHIECPECGRKWSRRAPPSYIHVCPPVTVVREDEGDG